MNMNEILSDNELDQVVGGFADDTYEDVANLKDYCGVDLATIGDYDCIVKVLGENYSSAGIKFHAHNNHPNEYYDMRNGKQIVII